MPASRDGLGPFYQDVIAVDPLEPWGIASAAIPLAGRLSFVDHGVLDAALTIGTPGWSAWRE